MAIRSIEHIRLNAERHRFEVTSEAWAAGAKADVMVTCAEEAVFAVSLASRLLLDGAPETFEGFENMLERMASDAPLCVRWMPVTPQEIAQGVLDLAADYAGGRPITAGLGILGARAAAARGISGVVKPSLPSSVTNAERGRRAAAGVSAYQSCNCGNNETEVDAQDLIGDLMHLLESLGEDPLPRLVSAIRCYYAERAAAPGRDSATEEYTVAVSVEHLGEPIADHALHADRHLVDV